MTDAVMQQRLRLRACDYSPVPLFGKQPALKDWQNKIGTNAAEIALWSKLFPQASNTGCLTRLMPTLDLDIMHPEAAERIEEFVRDAFGERGVVMARIGKAPKRAILFKTSKPFKKITALVRAPDGGEEKVEMLGDGQQLAVAGEHPETRKPYWWRSGAPWHVPRGDLPNLDEPEARALVDNAVSILADFGYTPAGRIPGSARGNGNGGNGDDRWTALVGNIAAGRALHDSFRDLAAMLILAGMNRGAACCLLHAVAELIEHYDARTEARLRDIPRAIDSAVAKYGR